MRGMCMSLSGLSECYGGCAECGGCIYLSRVSMSSLMCVCMGEERGGMRGGCGDTAVLMSFQMSVSGRRDANDAYLSLFI